MKRKTLTLAICFLALIAIVSVGFASWIITRPVQDASTAGSITTEVVTDESFSLLAEVVGSSTIHYGKPKGYAELDTSEYWLTNEDGEEESLEYVVRISSDNYEFIEGSIYLNIFLKETETLKNNAELTSGWAEINSGYLYQTDVEENGDENGQNKEAKTSSKFATAKALGYVDEVKLSINGADKVSYTANHQLSAKADLFGCKITYNNGSENVSEFKTVNEIYALAQAGKIVASFDQDGYATATTDAGVITLKKADDDSVSVVSVKGNLYCEVKFVFGWGSEFGYKNPISYYNGLDVDDNWEAAKAALEAINTIGEAGTSYKVVISTKTKNANLANKTGEQ